MDFILKSEQGITGNYQGNETYPASISPQLQIRHAQVPEAHIPASEMVFALLEYA